MSNLTVGDLVAMRQLACSVVAGAAGVGRTVVWAHVCELPDPWNWLSADDLLMTTGMCLPAPADEQKQFIRRLSEAGLAGIAIGDDLQAPPFTQDMLSAADELRFPVVTVGHATPFAAIGRTVAIAAQSVQVSRIARLSRLYDATQAAPDDETSLLGRLSAELGHQLHVVDVELGSEVLRDAYPLDDELIAQLRSRVGGRLDRLPPRIAIDAAAGTTATAFPLASHRKCMLVAAGHTDLEVDAFVLLHAQSLVGVEVERVTRERERTDVVRAELLEQMVTGSISADAATPRLGQLGFADTGWCVIGFDAARLQTARTLIGDRGIPYLSCLVGEEGYVMIPSADADPAADLLGHHIDSMGMSARNATTQRVPDSVRQARWALQAARAAGGGLAEYSTAAPLFLPRTLTEAHFATRAVLGKVIDYDAAHHSDLIETLDVFLSMDRNWSATAEKLVIHRQTLGYRLRKIETLTGRSVKSSADIADFWMALIARRISTGQA
ncbi:PucR family transcriptional regulator [Rhodococcus opacus]|nr:PucR family transcriptional regulator [Rhodococcus opacus]RZL74328.1 MAG: PucR family transcriptional regulator [Rhodococcus sp. (in: high G+C Gram-positive bacteria)]